MIDGERERYNQLIKGDVGGGVQKRKQLHSLLPNVKKSELKMAGATFNERILSSVGFFQRYFLWSNMPFESDRPCFLYLIRELCDQRTE